MPRKPKRPKGIDEHRGKWRYRFKLPGRPRVCEVTGLAATPQNLSVASALMEGHKARLLLGEPEPIGAVPFNEAADHFQAAMDAEHREKPETARRIKTSLASARFFFGNNEIERVSTTAWVEDYMTFRRSVHRVKEVTLRHDLFNLSMLFDHAVKRRWASVNPVKEVEKPSDEDSINTRIISDEEERVYLQTADHFQPLGDFALIILRQGLRPSETVALTTDVMDFSKGTLRITEGKSKAAKRTLKIHVDVAGLLARRVAAAQANDSVYLFPQLKLNNNGGIQAINWAKPQRVEQLCKTLHNRVCGMTGLDFVVYSMRHTFATRAYMVRPDALGLMRVLGHSNIKMVQRYVNDAEQHAREFMAEFERRTPVAGPEAVQ